MRIGQARRWTERFVSVHRRSEKTTDSATSTTAGSESDGAVDPRTAETSRDLPDGLAELIASEDGSYPWAEYYYDEIKSERERRVSLEQRGFAVISLSGVLIGLVLNA